MSLIRPQSDAELMPEIVAYAVPPFQSPGVRCPSLLRIKKVGQVYFVEHLRQLRTLGPDGKEVLTDDWKQVAVSKPPDARKDAFKWMQDANAELIKLSTQ